MEAARKKREEITQPKNDLERWLVGTYAIWGQFYAGLYGTGMEAARKGPFHIGAVPRTRETVQGMKETLDESWDITSYEELLDAVEYMSVGSGFQNCVSQARRAWKLSGSTDEASLASVRQRADIYWIIKGRMDSPYKLPWGMELDPKK